MEVVGTSLEVLDCLTDRLLALRAKAKGGQRILVGLAGVPGSGKSTISAALLVHLRASGYYDIAIAPMDGFHRRKEELAQFEDVEDAFRRRGAPHTFDAQRLVETVTKLKNSMPGTGDPSESALWLPSFDHAIQDPVEHDICIPAETRIVVIEGNYVLLRQHPWDLLDKMLDERWFVEVPRSVIKGRIAKRHVLAGIESSIEAAEKRAEENDLINGDLVMSNLSRPDIIIKLKDSSESCDK